MYISSPLLLLSNSKISIPLLSDSSGTGEGAGSLSLSWCTRAGGGDEPGAGESEEPGPAVVVVISSLLLALSVVISSLLSMLSMLSSETGVGDGETGAGDGETVHPGNVMFGQAKHAVAFGPGVKVPTAHGRQAIIDGGTYESSGHGWQMPVSRKPPPGHRTVMGAAGSSSSVEALMIKSGTSTGRTPQRMRKRKTPKNQTKNLGRLRKMADWPRRGAFSDIFWCPF